MISRSRFLSNFVLLFSIYLVFNLSKRSNLRRLVHAEASPRVKVHDLRKNFLSSAAYRFQTGFCSRIVSRFLSRAVSLFLKRAA